MGHLLAGQRLLWRSICLAVLLSSIPVWLVAGTNWAPIDPNELAMKSEPLAPGAAAIILYRQVDRDDNDRTAHEFNYVRIKILNEEGRKQADIEIPFVKNFNDVVGLKARTIRPDGSVVNFEGKAIEKSVVKANGMKYLAKTFSFPDVQVGSIIEYSYTYDYLVNYIDDSHWVLSDDLFTKHAKFSLKPYSNPDQRLSLRWNWQGLPPGTVPPKADADQVVRLEAFNIPPFQTEGFMPPENELKARVDFIYSEGPIDKDDDAYWKKVGKQLYDSAERWIGKRSSLEQVDSQIVAPSDTPEVKLRKIYARVQQIRNTSYEVEQSAPEEKHAKEKDATNALDVWNRGRGDAMQLTWLYLGLVRAAGFDAHGIMISDRAHYFFNPKLQDSSRLTSNVVQVRLNGMDIYCDPGAQFVPFGLLPWAETGVQGLLLDKNAAAWVRTPLPGPSASRIERTAQLKLSGSGDLEGTLAVRYTGLEAMVRRSEEHSEDAAERKKFLEDQVQEYIPIGSHVELTNQPDWEDATSTLVAEFKLKVPGWASPAGPRMLFPAALFGGEEKHVFESANRTYPIYFAFPFQRIDAVTVDLPAGWKVTSLPTGDKRGNELIAYNLKLENDKGKLHITRTLSNGVQLMEAKYYSALRDFYQGVRAGDKQQIVLQVQSPKPPSYPFDRYPAGKVYHGHPAPAKLVTAEQRKFRTVLRNGAKKGPNFAGHFTVVQWGCGSNCIAIAVVDAITGVVYDQHMPQMNDSGICGAQYKVTSTLFVVETSPTPNGDCEPELYRWEGSHFVAVSKP